MQAVSASDTPEERAEKYARLEQQEVEMRSFVDGAGEAKAAAESRLKEGQERVMGLLGDLRRLGEALGSSQLPTAKDLTAMKDELEYKRMQVESSKQTHDRLKVRDEGRSGA